MYQFSRDKVLSNFLYFYLGWFLYAFPSSAIMFFIPYMSYNWEYSISSINGKIEGAWSSGFAVFTVLVLVHHG